MNLRTLAPLHILLLAALTLSACIPIPGANRATPSSEDLTSSPEAESGTATPTQPPTSTLGVEPAGLQNLRIQAWHTFSGGSEQAILQLTEEFNATNEWDIYVELVNAGDAPALLAAVNTALESGTPPELVAALPEQTLAWEAAGAVVDMSPYMNDAIWGLEDGEFEDLPEVFRQQDMLEGRVLGMPAERSSQLLFYNSTWAKELGFEQPPANSDEFRAQACAANASFRADASAQDDGYGGWIIDSDWMGIYSWLIAFGGGVNGEDGYAFQTDANQAALEFLKGLREDGCAWMTSDPENPYALDPEPHYDQFARRTALFINGDLGEAVRLDGAMARAGSMDAWTVIPFPGSAGTAVTVYGPSYTLLTTSPERQLAAWLFVRWLLAPENQADWVELTGSLPLRSASLPLLEAYAQAHPQWAAAAEMLEGANGVPQMASWRTVRYILEDGTLSLFRLNLPLDAIPGLLGDMDATAQEVTGGE